MTYQFTPAWKALIKQPRSNECWGDVEKREPLRAIGGNVNWCNYYRKPVLEVPQKIKNRTAIWARNFSFGYLSEENKSTNSKRYMHPPCSLQHYLQEPRHGINLSVYEWWMDKENIIYLYLWNSSIKKEEILPFATTRMDLEGILLSETSRRKTNPTRSHIHVESKTKEQKAVPLPPRKQVHRYKEQTGGCQR